ncbi:MAG: hypothetical protein HY738_20810 [Bacteroidia bacterium]|nr:hypothetical protein [Bacteroidia bacterium]
MRIFTFIFLIILFYNGFLLFGQEYNIVWDKNYGGSQPENCFSMVKTSDGGYIILAGTASIDFDVTSNHNSRADFWVICIDSAGTLLWEKCYGGSEDDTPSCIINTSDGRYIMTGIIFSDDGDITEYYGSGDVWVVKINHEGGIIWQKSYGGSSFEGGTSIIQDSDSSYIITAVSFSADGDVTGNIGSCDIWLIRINLLGNIIWQKNIGGTDGDWPHEIIQDNDGNLFVVGETSSSDHDVSFNHGCDDMWIVAMDTAGEIKWEKTIDGSNGFETIYTAVVCSDNSLLVVGTTEATDGDIYNNHGGIVAFAARLDTAGQVIWSRCYGGSNDDHFNSISSISNENYIISGGSLSSDGDLNNNYGSG